MTDPIYLYFLQCLILFKGKYMYMHHHWMQHLVCRLQMIRYPFPRTSRCFYVSFKNNVGKEETAYFEKFLLFKQSFLPLWKIVRCFNQIYNCLLQTLSVWKSQNLLVGKGLNARQKTTTDKARRADLQTDNRTDEQTTTNTTTINV